MPGVADSPLAHPEEIRSLLLFRLSRVLSLGGSLVTRLCEGRFGITRREWMVIALLAPQASLTWTELVARAELDKARLSRAVTSLANKRLVEKRRGASRRLIVTLTEAGAALHAELFPLTSQINAKLLQDLDANQLAVLDEALQVIHKRAERLSMDIEVPKALRRLGARARPR
ncbi:MAG: MarR family transcriptional regulator [Burkholderiales bacterium]|nr:MarR family transcriptional regulator [Burkholderiales bacterium]